MEEAASMKLKHSILGLLLLFTLVPLGIFGIFSIYETNRKIDELTEQNVQAISENQVMNIKNFTQDRNNEMDIIANYQLTQDAILYSLGEKESPLARNYVDNLLKERKKYYVLISCSQLPPSVIYFIAKLLFPSTVAPVLYTTPEKYRKDFFSLVDKISI